MKIENKEGGCLPVCAYPSKGRDCQIKANTSKLCVEWIERRFSYIDRSIGGMANANAMLRKLVSLLYGTFATCQSSESKAKVSCQSWLLSLAR